MPYARARDVLCQRGQSGRLGSAALPFPNQVRNVAVVDEGTVLNMMQVHVAGGLGDAANHWRMWQFITGSCLKGAGTLQVLQPICKPLRNVAVVARLIRIPYWT